MRAQPLQQLVSFVGLSGLTFLSAASACAAQQLLLRQPSHGGGSGGGGLPAVAGSGGAAGHAAAAALLQQGLSRHAAALAGVLGALLALGPLVSNAQPGSAGLPRLQVACILSQGWKGIGLQGFRPKTL
jgi:hypothetical protein